MQTRIDHKFGRQIRELRQGRRLTQVALARGSGLSIDAVRRIERGAFSPSLETIRRLCTGLGVTMATLFQGLETGRRDDLAELCDWLASRSREDIALLRRLARALFEDEPARRVAGS